MKRVRIWIRAEYEFPDGTEIIEVTGEPAIKLGDQVVKPSLEFFELRAVEETTSTWTEAGEALYDSLVAAEAGFHIDLAQDEGAT
jgi:hypothetical protein